MNYLITGSSSSIGRKFISILSQNKKNNIYALYSSVKPKIIKNNIKYIKFTLGESKKTFNFKIKTNLDKLISIMMNNDLEIESNGK